MKFLAILIMLSGVANESAVEHEGRLDRMSSEDVDERRAAALECGLLENPSHQDVTALVELVKSDPTELVRRTAAAALAELGPKAEAAALELVPLLEDPERSERITIALAIGKIGLDRPEILVALEKMAVDGSEDLSECAVLALIDLGREAAPNLERLIVSDCPSKKTLLENVTRLGESALPMIGKALGSEDEELLTEAIWALGRLEADSRDIDEELLGKLEDPRERVRGAAAWSIGRRQVRDPRSIEALTRLAGDREQSAPVRVSALEALEQLELDAYAALPTLKQIVETQDDTAVMLAALSAWKALDVEWDGLAVLLSELIGSKRVDVELRIGVARLLQEGCPREAVEGLLDAVRSKNVDLRCQATWALRHRHLCRQPGVIKSLLSRTKDKSDSVRTAALAALCIDRQGSKARKALLKALRDKSANVRETAIHNLSFISDDSEDLSKWLYPCLEDEIADVRLTAALRLLEVGVSTEKIEAVVLEGLDSSRYWALRAVGEMETVSDSITEELKTMARAGEDIDRIEALLVLLRSGGRVDAKAKVLISRMLASPDHRPRMEALPVVPYLDDFEDDRFALLSKAAEDVSWKVRVRAMELLPGVPGHEVFGALARGLDDPQPLVRAAAIESLCKLAPSDVESVPLVLKALADESPQVRSSAAIGAGGMDPELADIDDVLIGRFESDPNEDVRDQARNALGRRTGHWR